MKNSAFVSALAKYLSENLPNADIHPFPRKLPPGNLVRGFVGLTTFHIQEVSSVNGPQTVEGVIVLYIPASDNDLYSEEWSYFEIIDRLGFDREDSLFRLFKNDRTLGGICNAFIAEQFNLLPYEDEDDDYSEGSFWSINIPFRAYV